MKNNLTCEIVEDLIPSYIDGLTSEVTNKAVREHLSHCDKCKTKLDTMSEPCSEEKIEQEKKEIDFLKKNRRKNIRTKLISLLAVVLVVAVAVCTLPYLGDKRISDYGMLYNLDVQGNTFKLTLIPNDREVVISDVERSSYGLGEYGIEVKGRKRNPFENREDYTWEYTYEAGVKTFKLGDRILWEDGEYISDITSAIFEHWHPYVGDVTANSQLAYVLGIKKYVGDYTTKLHTIAEPYGWSMTLNYELLPQQVEEKEALMRNYSYVLLALVDNVDNITFNYEIFNSDGDDKKCQLRTTRKQADKYFGDDIRKCNKDINELQNLMKMTGLADLPYSQIYDERYGVAADSSESIIFRILNNSKSDIQSIHMTWLDQENGIGMGFGIERDFLSFGHSKVNPGTYDFDLNKLSSNLYDESRLGTTEFQITVYDFDGNEYILDETVEVSAQFGAVYYLVLDGSFEDGFKVKIK